MMKYTLDQSNTNTKETARLIYEVPVYSASISLGELKAQKDSIDAQIIVLQNQSQSIANDIADAETVVTSLPDTAPIEMTPIITKLP